MLPNKAPISVCAFITEALSLAARVFRHDLLAVYVFGGVAKGNYYRETSDVDLLFIVSDSCSEELIEDFEKNMERLELKSGILQAKHDLLFYAFASKTAFFKSHFVVRIRSLLNLDFFALFKEGKAFNLALSNILNRILFSLCPYRLVIKNMLVEARLLYGKDLIKEMAFPRITEIEVIKVFITSYLLSVFGAISSLLSKSSTRFSLEAMKWYVLNVYSIIHNRAAAVSDSLEFVVRNNIFNKTIASRFAELKEKFSYDLMFNISLPVYLVIAHIRFARFLQKFKNQAYNMDSISIYHS